VIRKALITLTFLLPSAAFSEGTDWGADCENAMTQRDMNLCAYEAWMRADEDLNDIYGWAMGVAKGRSEATAEALRTAQRAWIPYRDAACEAEGIMFEGGTIQPLILFTCKEHLTRQRTEEMRAVYEMN